MDGNGYAETRGAGPAAKSLNIKAIKKGLIQNRCRKSKVSSSPAPKLQDSSAQLAAHCAEVDEVYRINGGRR
jgi:hypothetical protein